MTALPLLYTYRRCPYAIRARMALAVSGTAYEAREVSLRDKPPELIAASPKATVPVLVLPDGQVIDESLAIMRWALTLRDPAGWLSGENEDLIEINDGPFKLALDRYKYPKRFGPADKNENRTLGLTFLERLDQTIAARGFLGGTQPALADYAIFPFIRQFAATDQGWFASLPLPHLQRWLAAQCESSLFAGVMERKVSSRVSR
jgi:glutathione S-transferase